MAGRRSGQSFEDKGDAYMGALRTSALGLWSWIEQWFTGDNMDGVKILSMRVNVPQRVGEKYMVIVKGVAGDGTAVVCFGGGADYMSAMAELKARAEAQNIRWREDNPPPWAVKP